MAVERQPFARGRRQPALSVLGRAWLCVWLGLSATPLAAQQGPIRLFPDQPVPETVDRPVGPAVPGRAPEPGGEPPSTGGFQVEGLAPPEVDAIGLTGPSDGGFPDTLWAGSDPKLILALLSSLPVATTNPPLQDLTRRLLATGAPLDGEIEGGRVLGARVDRLLAMGDLDTAKRLVDQLPPSLGDSTLVRRAVETALLAGEDAGACQRAADLAPATKAAFWGQVAVYCRLAARDQSGARLALDLLREAGHTEDAAFFQLAAMVLDGGGAPPALPDPDPIHVALLRLAGTPFPATAADAVSPAVRSAVARDPALAGERQLGLAEQAFLGGGLSAESLATIYADAASSAEADALRRVRTAWGPAARALAYRAVTDAEGVPERATLLDALWNAASGTERFIVAEVFARPFAALVADRALIDVAPSAARALLGSDRPLPAARWFALLTAEAAVDARARSAAAGLAPLFALAGIGGRDAVPQLDEAGVAAWQSSVPGAAPKAARLFALLGGVGSPVPDRVWWRQIAAPPEDAARAPAVALWRGLERAVSGKRLGETILFVLHMLDGRPEAVHPEALVITLRALRAVGLDQEARAIAVATALTMDL